VSLVASWFLIFITDLLGLNDLLMNH